VFHAILRWGIDITDRSRKRREHFTVLTLRMVGRLLSSPPRSSTCWPRRPHEPKIQMENGAAMKVKLTTKQKRDRRWKIKRRKLRREKHGV